MGTYLFTSESVSEGHPDKVADQISDAILDYLLAYDNNSKVACETLVTTGLAVVAGEIKTEAYVDLQDTVREVINNIGYTKGEYKFDGGSCGVLSAIHEQSGDINRGVERKDPESQGAGDQGMMFGYATNETPAYLPLSLYLSHVILRVLADIRKKKILVNGKPVMTYLRPDSKSQVTVEYADNGQPLRIDTIVVSTQHDDWIKPKSNTSAAQDEADKEMLSNIRHDVINILMPEVKKEIHKEAESKELTEQMKIVLERIEQMFEDKQIHYFVNPTGKFVIGGPNGDTGLTGRKIIVDTYGGKGAHGGGAFSGKDPSKVDRSAAYAARYIAKNMVAAGIADEMLVQLSYAIGEAYPVSIYVNTYGKSHVNLTDGEIARRIGKIASDAKEDSNGLFDLRPYAIERDLKLRNPIYLETATYGHFGRKPEVVEKTFSSRYVGDRKVKVELFTWEKLDSVDKIKTAFASDFKD